MFLSFKLKRERSCFCAQQSKRVTILLGGARLHRDEVHSSVFFVVAFFSSTYRLNNPPKWPLQPSLCIQGPQSLSGPLWAQEKNIQHPYKSNMQFLIICVEPSVQNPMMKCQRWSCFSWRWKWRDAPLTSAEMRRKYVLYLLLNHL